MVRNVSTKAQAVSAHFFLCEDVRSEAAGKLSLMGFFPDSIVIAQLLKTTEFSPDEPLVMEGLCILASVRGLTGRHIAKVVVDGPSPEKKASMERELVFSEYGTANLIIRMRPYVVGIFGKKTVVLEVAGQTFEGSYEIRRGALVDEEVITVSKGAKKTASKRPAAKKAAGKTGGTSGGKKLRTSQAKQRRAP